MKIRVLDLIRFAILWALGITTWVSAQSPHSLSSTIADPGAPTLTYRSGGDVFGEGVAADWSGNVFFNEMGANNRTMRLPVGHDTSLVWRQAKDAPNGMWLDTQNRLIICQTRALVRVSTASVFENITDTLYKYSTNADFNDVTGDSKDNLYFTNYSGKSVFFRNAQTKETKEVLSGRASPNGVEWDEERKILYVCENAGGIVESYTVNADFSLTKIKDFATVSSSDGIVLDELGNVYVVAFGNSVNVYAPDGKSLGKIPLSGSQLTNLAFGGADFKTLFMITNKGLYKLPMKVRGYKTGKPSVSIKKAPLDNGLFRIDNALRFEANGRPHKGNSNPIFFKP